jgi:glycosyltransferase involved in cell wall biosynthesis
MQKLDIEALIKDFNQKNTILVVSKYPYKNIGESFHGVAVYTRDTLEAIAKKTEQKFVILVEKKYDRQIEVRANGSILILPVFNNHPALVFKELFTAISQFDQIKNIQLHSEFYNSGNLVQMSLLLPFLYLLRLQGKIVSFVAHNVVHDFSFLTNHLGKKENNWKLNILSKLIPWYYRFLSFGVEQFITLDESISNRLSSYLWQKNKVKTTAIWLKNKTISTKKTQTVRQQFGIKEDEIVLSVFGFMSRYKGVDVLLENFLRFKKEFPKSKFKLFLAGGMAPSQKDQKHYQDFYAGIEKLAKKDSDITLTGFIPSGELKNYMALTDVVLLPYKGILGASASWATVLSYGKACFFSKSLAPYFNSPDVKETLAELNMAKEDLIFEEDYQSFRKLLLSLQKDRTLLDQATNFSKLLSTFRDEKVCIFRDFPPLYFSRSYVARVKPCYNLGDEKIAV